MTGTISLLQKRPALAEERAQPSPERSMRRVLARCVDFAAQAIAEALARRGSVNAEGAGDAAYSAASEVARLVTELAGWDHAPLGLDAAGAAWRARAELDELLKHDPQAPLGRLERGLGLVRSEQDVLRLLLAWQVEPRIGLLVGHVHDALQRTRPSAGALAEILNDPVEACLALDPSSMLRRLSVVDVSVNGPDGALGLDARVVCWVLTGSLPPLATIEGSLDVVAARALPDAARARAEQTAIAEVVVIRGPPGSGRRTLAQAIAEREGRALLHLHVRAKEAPPALLAAAIRDARTLGARLLVSGTLDDGLLEALSQADVHLAVALEPAAILPEPLLSRRLALVGLETPSCAERVAMLRGALGMANPASSASAPSEAALTDAAERYAFTPGQMQRAALQARSLGLDAACRLQLRHRLNESSSMRPTRAGWDRLVLPEPALAALRAIVCHVQHRHRVDEVWGFARHHSLGHGVKALFFGRPGTGKTLAAEIVAGELDMPLYRIDVSRIVSKWIGETEQNLARVFDEAKQGHAVIFFDEADSLFGRRTAIESATDRYANMEVNYLLQRIEEHDGAVLLATNLKANMDEGFARRLHFAVEFPDPDERGRSQIWRLSLPPGAPLDQNVDFDHLARRFELSGGAIKNVLLGAAHLAAAEDTAIGRRHIGVALAREYAKMDRLYNRAELDALMT